VPRFFSAESYWNQPIGPDPQIDPRNDFYLSDLVPFPVREFRRCNWFGHMCLHLAQG
jgi:hypothetical protein